MGVLSEAIHSLLDLASAAVSYVTVREAGKPADREHPFGHGKIETLSSLFESFLLLAAAGWMVWEGVDRLKSPQEISHEWVAIGTMAISLVVSYLAYLHNMSAAIQTESSALRVNALHFLSDVAASIGVLFGLLLIQFTGWLWVDSVMAFAVAIYIVAISYKQVRDSLLELIDVQLPQHEIDTINATLDPFRKRVLEIHDLRTRRSGATRHIDFHLVVCGVFTVNDSHAICDEMEAALEAEFPQASVTIHVEPCAHIEYGCNTVCAYEKKKN